MKNYSMNCWILSELEKIDTRTEKILNEFDNIRYKVSQKTFNLIYQPNIDKLKECYSISKLDIHQVQNECTNSINNFYEYN